jgi:transposase InsO family protein
MARHQTEYAVRLMARILGVSPSGFYTWCRRPPCQRSIADEMLIARVRIAHAASDETYGAPRVHRDLRAEGLRVGKKRVARLMRAEGLVGQRRKAGRVRTTDSTHPHPIAPNRLERRFDVHGMPGLDRVWVSDLTYVPTAEGWLYLAVVLDLASRRVVGWAMRPSLEGGLARSALEMALTARRPAPGLLHHSDRGVQYACADYRALLTAHGIEASMSRKGDCWDNAVAESFFATLELELIARHRWVTRAAARQAIFHYIETWYNPRRRHSTLGYVSPAAYERQLTEDAA